MSESGTAAVERAWPALQDLAANAAGPVLVVMHSTLMRLILCRALGLPLDAYRRAFPSVKNVATTVLSMQAGRARLLAYNLPTASHAEASVGAPTFT